MLRFVNKKGEEKFTIKDNGEMDFKTAEERIAYEKSLTLQEGEDKHDEGENA